MYRATTLGLDRMAVWSLILKLVQKKGDEKCQSNKGTGSVLFSTVGMRVKRVIPSSQGPPNCASVMTAKSARTETSSGPGL